MTPKEKAIELYSMYYNRIEHTLSEEYSPHEKDVVKKCVLVAVDEIINSQWQFGIVSQYGTPFNHYWEEVKQEIEKL